jgi:hypothetical protein
MCSNCKVKAASGVASDVPPQALSTMAVATHAIHAFLEKNCFICNFLRLFHRPKVIAQCDSIKKISCQKFEYKTGVFLRMLKK